MAESEKEKLTKLQKAGAFFYSVFMPLLIFILAQLVIFFALMPFIPGLRDENVSMSINETFIYAGFFELAALGLVWLLLKRKKVGLSWIGLGDWPKLKNLALIIPAAGVYIIAAVASFLIVEILWPTVNLDQEQVIGFEGANGLFELSLAFIALVILTPLTEEVLMRGITFRNLNRIFGFWIAAFVSAAVFGLLHGQLNVFIDTFVLGIVLAWLVNKTDSLWPAIGLHGLKNLIAFMYLFVF